MKVKCLINECDVAAGKIYVISHINYFKTAYIVEDDVGEEYALLEGEYEVVTND